MVGWVGKGLGGGWYASEAKPRGFDRMSGDAAALPKCEEGTQMTPDHTALQVRRFG